MEQKEYKAKTTRYPIKDAEGRTAAIHVRIEWVDADGKKKKRFLWEGPGGESGLNGTPVTSLPLYGSEKLPDLPGDLPVLAVEGERCADIINESDLGIFAVGTVTGAGKTPSPEVLEVLRGREVVLWPDAKDGGRAHMAKMGEDLEGVADEIRWYDPWPELQDDSDAADHEAIVSGNERRRGEILNDLLGTPRFDSSKHGVEVSGESKNGREFEPPGDTGISGTAALPYRGSAANAAGPALELVRFAGRPRPGPREYFVPDLIPRYYPTTLYGWGGTAKSLLALLLGMGVAGGRDEFLGCPLAVHGPVLFLDFELEADEQHRRVLQLAAGLGARIPDNLLYASVLGMRTHDVIGNALSICEEHGAVMVILDSLGPAMVGDMVASKDVIEFNSRYIAPFREAGATPLLIDHQARQQGGEGYQSKGAFGSSYKEHLSRSLIQVERGDQSAEEGTLNIRLRHKKSNFAALRDPFDVTLQFSAEKITAAVRELAPADKAQEQTLKSTDRVRAALEDGPAYPDDLAELTGLRRGTVKNAITALKKSGAVETTGEVRGQMEQVQLAAPAARHTKGSAASAAGPDSTNGHHHHNARAQREISELIEEGMGASGAREAVISAQHGLSSLAAALQDYLRLNPGRRAEGPSWLANALWAEEWVLTKPTPAAVSSALKELGAK